MIDKDKEGNKLPLSTRLDPQDLFDVLKGLEKSFDVPVRGVTKSRAVCMAVQFAAQVIRSDEEAKEHLSSGKKEALERLETEFLLSFTTKRQKRAISEMVDEAKTSQLVDQAKDMHEAEKKAEERFEELKEKEEESIEEEKERLKRIAREQGNLVDEESNQQEETERVKTDLILSHVKEMQDPAPSLIQVGQINGWTNEEIAQQLSHLYRNDIVEISKKQFLAIKDFFEQSE